MVNLLNIVEGWSKSLGLLPVSESDRELSRKRMAICAKCPLAGESSFLKLVRGRSEEVPAIYCSKCTCPINEKSLVKKESCPLGKWT